MIMRYHVITCNQLPSSKRTFECRCEALSYIKKMVDKRPKDVEDQDIVRSVRMYRIDTEKLDKSEKFMPDSA